MKRQGERKGLKKNEKRLKIEIKKEDRERTMKESRKRKFIIHNEETRREKE